MPEDEEAIAFIILLHFTVIKIELRVINRHKR